jgi:hypothetical protein
MNINMTLKCDTCGACTNCRIGMSNRDEQPLSYCCLDCGAPIELNIGATASDIKGAQQVPGAVPFDAKTNFVDLHLDFPVSFDKYVMGMTPFMRAIARIGHENYLVHNHRLEQLNASRPHFPTFELILKLYRKRKIRPFTEELRRTFKIEVESEAPQDINAALYQLISGVMSPFARPGQSQRSVELFTDLTLHVATKDQRAWDRFIDELIDTKFLKALQGDCLQIYPRVLQAELPLRPALFLDFDHQYHQDKLPMRVSQGRFENLKDLFKDVSEIIARQLVLVAGINNLLKRCNHDKFLTRPPKANGNASYMPKTLAEFADLDFGRKQAFIDDPWYVIADEAVNNRLRNAIAHVKADYDDITQSVRYYPKKEGLERASVETLSFLEFLRWLLSAYREMHQLHHLVKCLFYYRFLIQKRDA